MDKDKKYIRKVKHPPLKPIDQLKKEEKYDKVKYYKRKTTLIKKSEELAESLDVSVMTITISKDGKISGYVGGVFKDIFEKDVGKALLLYCKKNQKKSDK